MKKFTLLLVIIFVLFFIKNIYAYDNICNVLKFSLGIITSYTIHEMSHVAISTITDNNIKFESIKRLNGYYKNNTELYSIKMAGLTSQVIGTECIIHNKKYKKSPFKVGYLSFNILNEISYSIIGYNTGDFSQLPKKDLKHVFQTFFVVHGLLTAYRMYKDYECNLDLICYNNKVCLKFNYKF